MNNLRLLVLLGLTAALPARGDTGERNAWPVRVTQLTTEGRIESERSFGPFLFSQPTPGGGKAGGFRPFYVEIASADGRQRTTTFLYPIFLHRTDGERTDWSFIQLINRSGRAPGAPIAASDTAPEKFDIWPFWFSRDTGSPDTSYQAFFPFAGTIKHRFSQDRITWTVWPFYMQSEKSGATTTSTPWPFIRHTRGPEQGFALWPLYGWHEKPGAFRRNFALWPLIWNNTVQPPPDAPVGTPPTHQLGALPFYTREQGPGFINENYLWPFFGYTTRTEPKAYAETRYLWPFLVQGRGDGRYINRWGPFYTHSIVKGVDKRWVLWPLYREATWTDAGITQTKTQFLSFLVWSLDQRSATNPALPHASKFHFWPLVSEWDNGAGRKQLQFPSPLEVFFPDNEHVRRSWKPLFALYRYDERTPENIRHDWFWGAITSRRDGDRREFHLGPLFSSERSADSGRIALGNGLLGLKRGADGRGWRLFWFDFPAKAAQTPSPTR